MQAPRSRPSVRENGTLDEWRAAGDEEDARETKAARDNGRSSRIEVAELFISLRCVRWIYDTREVWLYILMKAP